MAGKIEFSFQSKEEWIELFPYGVTIGLDEGRPVLVLKDKSEKHVLPVWLNPLDAGISMAISGDIKHTESPHSLSHQIFKKSHLKFEKCLFKSVKGHHQFVEIHFKQDSKGDNEVSPIEMRADYTMSICLQEKVRFFSTIKHMDRCRQLDVEMEQLKMSNKFGEQFPVIDRPGYLN